MVVTVLESVQATRPDGLLWWQGLSKKFIPCLDLRFGARTIQQRKKERKKKRKKEREREDERKRNKGTNISDHVFGQGGKKTKLKKPLSIQEPRAL